MWVQSMVPMTFGKLAVSKKSCLMRVISALGVGKGMYSLVRCSKALSTCAMIWLSADCDIHTADAMTD